MPRKDLVDAFMAEEADAAIDLTNRIVLPFYVLLSHSKIPMKMGLFKSKHSPYNFQIQTPDRLSPAELGEFLLRYWRAFVVEEKNNS